MDCPKNIENSASQLFFQDKSSLEYEALVVVSTLPHPQRAILASFVLAAVDRESAAQYLLHETSDRGSGSATTHEFIADWITLATNIRPTLATGLDEEQKQLLIQRDDGSCCFSQARDPANRSDNLVPVSVVRSNLFDDLDMNPRRRRMLDVFLGADKVSELRAALENDTELSTKHLEQLLLISKQAFCLFQNGQLSLNAMRSHAGDAVSYIISSNYLMMQTRPDWVSTDIVSFVDRTAGLAAPPNPLFIEVNHRFSKTLSWIQVAESMKADLAKPSRSGLGFLDSPLSRPVLCMLQYALGRTPAIIRAYVCRSLTQIGHCLYGPTLSDRTHRLPFGLYLRVEEAKWGPRHQAEFESLRLVQRHTNIPAPRPVDTFQYGDNSYLIMTRVPGRPIGTVLPRMTDKQVQKATRDLSEYVAQLRSIPSRTFTGVRICNSLGRGILDWRIGETQQQELSFATVAEFHQHLTADYSKDLQDKAQRSHSKDYDIVFTHGDLNPRNILADENGTITGIVDWECSGWFPEYWEYTKAHFAVRYTIRWLADVVDRLFTGYREELWVENMLTDYGRFI
ncbi:hypothetical protein AC578_2600 [Pseudocercospora eumusae]|uniref:Aminoglycoside phosphotransferase domain-containing protein n=1 Tax=Pseudocercospora eumusae TaxID=321146 RepID=A0A139GTZ3_9PEZI|nr:hypothetical protein AC578_2600 [Pseudocercospora eumusae]